MNIKHLLREGLKKIMLESFKKTDEETFDDALLNLVGNDLEDSQVRYPKIDSENETFLFGGNGYNLFVLNKSELPSHGSFELVIENDDDEIIGFIRGNKTNKMISFNLIHISEESRGNGIGSSIYVKFLEEGYIIKSDKEITDSTYNVYKNLFFSGYKPLIFDDGSVGLVK